MIPPVDDEAVVDPEKASQNAEPMRVRSVWLARAATKACCCVGTTWVTWVWACCRGDDGGVRRPIFPAFHDDDPEDDELEALPDISAANVDLGLCGADEDEDEGWSKNRGRRACMSAPCCC